MSHPVPQAPLLRICNVPVSVPIWECIRQMKCVFPLYKSPNCPSDRNGCFETLLLLCEHHFDIVIEYETTLYCEIRRAAERIVTQYFRWNCDSSPRVMRDYCPRQLLMVLLWITPKGKKPAHSWIERALCKFFNSRPIDRAQILWIARFVNGYDRNIYTASSRSLFHLTPSERLFGVHPVDRCYFWC